MSLSYVDSQPDTHIKASVFEVDPKVLSRNAPESIGESKHFTIASSLRGEVTATRKIGPTRHFDSSPHAISPGWSALAANLCPFSGCREVAGLTEDFGEPVGEAVEATAK